MKAFRTELAWRKCMYDFRVDWDFVSNRAIDSDCAPSSVDTSHTDIRSNRMTETTKECETDTRRTHTRRIWRTTTQATAILEISAMAPIIEFFLQLVAMEWFLVAFKKIKER